MKKLHLLPIILCVLCAYVVSSAAQDFKEVHPGVEYAKVSKEISGLNVNINLLKLDLTKVRLDVVHAMDAAIGMEKTSSIATRHGAIAAINAGFFRLDGSIFAGEDTGVLRIDGNDLSEGQNDRIALIIDNAPNRIMCVNCYDIVDETSVTFDHLKTWNGIVYEKTFYEIPGINRERRADDIVVYTPEFGRTTLTDQTGIEIVVVKDKIVRMIQMRGSTAIPKDGYVISVTGKNIAAFSKMKIGTRILYKPGNYVEEKGANGKPFKSFRPAEDIVAGIPQLIKNGKIDITWEQEKASKSFVETRHPRTALAKLKDGKFLMVTVDGRSESSGGIGLQDLAEYLLSLGAVDAMNLDGGGSTTMYLDGKVVNTPSDKEGERKVGDAILVTLRKKK